MLIYVSLLIHPEKAMAPHSSTVAWKISWMEEPGRLKSMGSLRVRHDWATSLSLFTFHFHALEKEMATQLQCSCLENPRDGGAWWAAVYGVAQSWTRLKRLSSSSSSSSWFIQKTNLNVKQHSKIYFLKRTFNKPCSVNHYHRGLSYTVGGNAN